MSIKPSLTIDDWSREGPMGLVNTSTVCSEEGINDGMIILNRTFSWIKCISTSICLDHSCKKKSEESIIADLLSQNNWDEPFSVKPNSLSIYQAQRISHVPWSIAWYLASVKDLKTTACFLLFHGIRWLP